MECPDDVVRHHWRSLIDSARQRIEQKGTVCATTGILEWDVGHIWLHTDFGPVDQEKDTNQDHVVAWVPHPAEAGKFPRWAIAMADGVTSSYFAEVGAQLACWEGLADLAEAPAASDACTRSLDVMRAVGARLAEAVKGLHERPEQTCPPDEMLSNWKFVLRRGLLLQTTLTLAWQELGRIHVAAIGDGGAAIATVREGSWDTRPLFDPPQSRFVNALGPIPSSPEQLDRVSSWDVDGEFRLALFTDGVAGGLATDVRNYDRMFEALAEPISGNPAQTLIHTWVDEHAADFSDNLTLALIAGRP